MNIGFVADKLNISQGGSNFSLDLIARSLVERGHDVTVMTVNFAHDNDFPEEPSYEILEAPLDGGSRAADARGIYQRLTQHDDRFDIYHVFNPALHPVAGAYRRRHETPVVGRLNTYDAFCTNLGLMDGDCQKQCTVAQKFRHATTDTTTKLANVPKYAFDTYGLPRLLNQMDQLFALSPQVDQIYQDIGVSADRLSRVPNFYDPSFGENSDGAVSFDGGFSVLYVGALKFYKGVDLLVESAANLPPEVNIEIVGDGPDRKSSVEHAADLGVENRVTFHGRVDHSALPRYYRAADVFVHPGRWPEPFNRTLLEAMQCDCPLVVSDAGAPPWVVGDTGLVFDRGDHHDLSRKIETLVDDSTSLRRLRDNCEERLERFTPERSVSLLEAQYREFVS